MGMGDAVIGETGQLEKVVDHDARPQLGFTPPAIDEDEGHFHRPAVLSSNEHFQPDFESLSR
jgi:hypothetical protein